MTHEFERDQRARKRTRNSRDALRVPLVALALTENAMILRAPDAIFSLPDAPLVLLN